MLQPIQSIVPGKCCVPVKTCAQCRAGFPFTQPMLYCSSVRDYALIWVHFTQGGNRGNRLGAWTHWGSNNANIQTSKRLGLLTTEKEFAACAHCCTTGPGERNQKASNDITGRGFELNKIVCLPLDSLMRLLPQLPLGLIRLCLQEVSTCDEHLKRTNKENATLRTTSRKARKTEFESCWHQPDGSITCIEAWQQKLTLLF